LRPCRTSQFIASRLALLRSIIGATMPLISPIILLRPSAMPQLHKTIIALGRKNTSHINQTLTNSCYFVLETGEYPAGNKTRNGVHYD
jgi:hypothetical protein